MPIINRIAEFHDDMTAWRRDLHAHPETAFEEFRTAEIVAGKLEEFGVEVDRGLAGTGVIGTIRNGDGPVIALRADMDALDILEANDFAHKSTHEGKMHACGHDDHTTMLLGAARYLAETKRFKGTVHFVFQPAEENEGGARVMVEEGIFDKFPIDAIYGMHNWPGMDTGRMGVMAGPVMSAYDVFEITVVGRSAHGAMPHQSVDPVVVGAQIVNGLQTIASRSTDPQQSAVVSVTQFHAGDTWNVIPDKAVLAGTTRSFTPEIQDHIESSVSRIAESIAAAHGAEVEIRYERRYPSTINHEAETGLAAQAAAGVVGAENVMTDVPPSMGSEDFAFFLREKPGCYVWLGNGPGDGGCLLHNSKYDFNDEILTVGASYWATLTEQVLG